MNPRQEAAARRPPLAAAAAEPSRPDELVRALRAGETWAASAVWNAYASKVFRIAARVLGSESDAIRGRRLTRRIDTRDAPPDHVAEVLAVRAVELVHASLVELGLSGARPSPAACSPAKAPDPSWGLEAGTSVLVSPSGVGPAVLTFARLRFAPIRRLELRLAFSGLGMSPRVEGPVGASARVTQLLALSEVALRPWPDLRVRPSFSLSAGALEVSAEGEAPSPYRGREATAWAALLGGGAGAEVLVGPRFGLTAEVIAFAAVPYPAVRFLGQEAARVGVPGLLASVTLVGWL